jgi:hypothetical protein
MEIDIFENPGKPALQKNANYFFALQVGLAPGKATRSNGMGETWMPRPGTALLAACIALAPATAHPDAGDLLDAARFAGAPRLAAAVLLAPGATAEMREAGRDVLTDLGHAPWATPGRGAVSAAPFLRYDDNLNGGFPADAVVVQGRRFEIAEENRAVSGLIGGVAAFGGWRKGLGDGVALEVNGAASLGVAPMQGLVKASLAGEVCLRRMARIDLNMHACVDGDHQSHDLGRGDRVGVAFGGSRILAAFGALHEVRGEIRLDRHLDAATWGGVLQPILSIATTSILPGPSAWFARADLGAPAGEHLTMRSSLRLGRSWIMAERPVTLAAGWERSAGGRFLGEDRVDDLVTVSGSIALTDRISLHLSVGRTFSTAGPFDRTSIDGGVSFGF